MTIKGRLFRTVVYAGGGAAAAYFFDPERGRTRRTQARDQVGASMRRAERTAEARLRYAEGKAEGLLHTVSSVPQDPPADDRALSDRIRSELGDRFPDETAEMTVVDGTVELRGQVGDEAAKALLVASVKKVPGVRRVVNLLHTPDQPAPNKAEAEAASQAAAAATNPTLGTAIE
jgi:osmotically-inducible protein OsmY